MDDKTKKQIQTIMGFIKKEDFNRALQEAEIIIYKGTKVVQFYLMAGYCYDKLNRMKEAEQSFLEVLDINPNQEKAIKALGDLYSKQGNLEKSMHFMELNLQFLKNKDKAKYMQNLAKLVKLYEKNLDMERIDKIFKELVAEEDTITEDFVAIAQSYFKTGVTNQCFFLQQFEVMGVHGEEYKKLQPAAREKFNQLLIDIIQYLYSVRLQYKMQYKDISNSIFQMRQYFPQPSCFLMMMLLDDLSISHAGFSETILQEIYLFLTAVYDKADTSYLNIEVLEPQMFVVTAILSYQYMAFFKEFFTLHELFNPYYEKLQSQLKELSERKVREQYANKITNFLLKQCRVVNRISQTQNVQTKLQNLKTKILRLQGSYLEQVLAKMAMNCFVNYQKLQGMKNLLKIRINNLGQQEIQPHLYKYYYDYLIKIAKLYKCLDQQLSIYQIIQYINKNDQNDYKYRAEGQWIAFSRASKSQNPQDIQEQAKLSLQNIQQFLPKLIGSVKSLNLRRKSILNIFMGNTQELLDGLKLALGTDRSFENLLCMGFYYFKHDNYERALNFLKEAFIINQSHYHLNRAIFIALVQTGAMKEAYGFLQRIYEGFPNIYWVNYALAMNAISCKRISAAQKYLSAALEAFMAGVNQQFKFSFQKTIEGPEYSLIYMITQNQYHILFDQFLIPQEDIFKIFPYASSLYFKDQKICKLARLQTQLGEMLKILGRTKSSYCHLYAAYHWICQASQQQKCQYPYQELATTKEYGTVLFYVRAFKESQAHLRKAAKICKCLKQGKQINKDLLQKYEKQINSLLFQVCVMRLSQMMKFQSFQSVEEYINIFNQGQYEVKHPSLNYYKSKYQFHILCYLHNKIYGIQKGLSTIQEFLKYFKLNVSEANTDHFYNRLVELKNEERILVKECLEDYYVLKYINNFDEEAKSKGHTITHHQIMPLIQLFPQSTVFYIVYGMCVPQNKLKIASFLKCIQINRESPISVDLLASLYLKEKDYLTACKLFLKSLQIDLFNPKSYIGLCNCLFVMIGNAINKGTKEDYDLIHRALNKINSYMQFMRIVDPSQNYHLLKFLKTLISDEPVELFQVKAGLQQSRKLISHKFSTKLLYKMLEESTLYLQTSNIWNQSGKQEIIKKYLQKNKIDSSEGCRQIVKSLLKKAQTEISEFKVNEIVSSQMRLKIKCKILNQVNIAVHLLAKSSKVYEEDQPEIIAICKLLQEESVTKDQQLLKLQKSVKEGIMLAVIVANAQHQQNRQSKAKETLQKLHLLNKHLVFKNIITYGHVQQFCHYFDDQLPLLKRYIVKSMHNDPCDNQLRKALLGWLVTVEKKNHLNAKKIKNVVNYRIQSTILMNRDQLADKTYMFHKKNAIMNNVGDKNAWVGFIAHQWKTKRQSKWIQVIRRLLQKGRKGEGSLTQTSRSKCEALLAEMIAQKMLQKSQKCDKNSSSAQLYEVFKGQMPCDSCSEDTLKYIIPNLVSRYEYDESLAQILQKCCQVTTDPSTINYYRLLSFISISSKKTTNEDELIQQLKQLMEIISICQEQKGVQTNSLAVMKCMVALLSLNFQLLEDQLNIAADNRFATQSDQILINYFEVMRAYKEVQQNHQAEGVFENFTMYVTSMIASTRDPMLRGFFIAIQAMANTVLTQQNSSLSRQLKMALLLSPVSGKTILAQQS